MITDNDKVILPIGIEVDGVRYREVVIDEMTGIDEENLSSRKVRNNGAKAISLLLRRSIQKIEGLVEQKRDPLSLIDEKWVRAMYVADRDFLIMCIRTISGDPEVMVSPDCPECGHENAHLVDLRELDVYEWDESEVPMITIDLPRGFYNKETEEYCKRLTWKFPKGSDQEKMASLPENQMGTNLIAFGIQEIEGMTYSPSLEDVRNLSIRDRNAIAQAILDNQVGADTNVEVDCEACGHEFKVEVNTVGFSNLGQRQTQKPSNVGTNGRRLRKRI